LVFRLHLDLATAPLTHHQTDICIIGSGVAGLSLARRLLAAGRTVTLLESGGSDYEAIIADLNEGEIIGQPYYPLKDSRLRFFGGATAIWGGRIAELDAVDFIRRDWVPHSGWPVSLAELEPYYAEAWKTFGIDRQVFAARRAQLREALPDFDPSRLAMKHWVIDNRFSRFTFAASGDILRHPRCTVVTHATITDIRAREDARTVTAVLARSLSGHELLIKARAFALAAGGLENPRLLLSARSTMKMGLGNQHDLVGRYFMEHPHARGGRILTGRSWMLLKAFGRRAVIDGRKTAPLITVSDIEQARLRMLNSSLTIVARQPADASQFWTKRAYNKLKHEIAPTRTGRAIWMHTKRAVSYMQRRLDPLRPWLTHQTGLTDIALLVRAEQAPNPESRVLLSDKVDAFGIPRIKLDWRLSDLDIHSVECIADVLHAELRRLKLGEVAKADWLSGPERNWHTDSLISGHPIGGYHHMGTTRMAEDPRQGVTDGFGRVHGIENLYIAGSSLFPTSGWANPTLTIVALALRTADHMAERFATSGMHKSEPRKSSVSITE
jgi:choline dehydrogenase-like flavoprotein